MSDFEKWESPDGRIVLYRGDCLQILPTLAGGSMDAVMTDPPFAITGGLSNGMTSRNDTQFFEYWFSDVAKHLIRISKPEAYWFLWCDWRTTGSFDKAISKACENYNPWWISQIIVHDRQMIGMGSPFRNQCDWIALVRGKKSNFKERIPKTQPNIIQSYSYYGKHEHHPAEKTVEVVKQVIQWASDAGDVVLDPFMGSGTSGIAALMRGNRFIGIEQDPKYFQIAKRRIEQAIADKANELPLVMEETPHQLELQETHP
jgi:DNA modification methylase